MKNFLLLMGTGVWCLFVFVATLWFTFPSEELGQRLRAEVPLRLGRDLSAEVGSVGPWWVGLGATDLKLYRDKGDGAALAAVFEKATIAVSPFRSLYRGLPYVVGRLDFVDGSVSYQFGTAHAGRKGNDWTVSDVVLWSDGVPIGDLLALSERVPATLSGNVTLDIDIRAGANGMSDSSGHLRIHGTDLTLSNIDVPGVGPLGMEIPLQRVDLSAEVKDGAATFDQGLIGGPLFTIDLKGSVGLRDPIERSNVDLEIVLSNLGDELRGYEGFLAAAKGTDGNWHFFCRGTVARMSQSACTPGKPSTSSRVRGRTASGLDEGDGAEEPLMSGSESDEDRRKRREEIRERLRQKREERRNAVAGGTPVVPTEKEPPPEVEELPPIEEPPLPDEEELPPEPELPLEEDEPPPE